jgi:4-hydroxybenzoate polyprenyltransferase
LIGIRKKLRTGDWWSSKIPPLLAAACGAALIGDADWRAALPALGRLLLAIVAVAGFGYVLNDAFDVEEDRKRGKFNAMAALARWQQAALLLLLASLSAAPLVGGPFGWISASLVAANLSLPMLYSIPPIRLKERGILGAMVDALGAHVVPTLFFGISMAAVAARPVGWRMTGFVLAAACWALMTGLRGIVVHQVRDRESDLEAGVRTFAGAMDLRTARTLVYRRIFPTELLALSVLLWTLVPDAPILLAVVPLYLFFELLRVLDDWRLPLLDADDRLGDPYVPVANNELYEVWLPLSLGIQLAATALPWAILPLLQLIVFLPNLRERFKDVASLTPVVRWFLTGRGRAPLCISPYSESDASSMGFTARKLSDEMTIFVAGASRPSSAADLFSKNLARGLRERGLQAVILLCDESRLGDEGGGAALDHPLDVPSERLSPSQNSRWGAPWVAMVRFLEHQAPCIYVPNGSSRLSSVVPLLSDKIGVARVVHHDFDQLEREFDKVLLVKDRMWKPGFQRTSGPWQRLKAFAGLCWTSRRPPS